VDDGVHVGPALVNLAVDESLGVELAVARVERVAVKVEFQDIAGCDELRRERAR
jgi:hypothetical protein